MAPADPPSNPRETLLTVLLAGIALTFFAGLLILISGGFFFWVLLFAAGMGLFAGIHYLLWGWMLPREDATLPDQDQLTSRVETDAWPVSKEDRIRRP